MNVLIEDTETWEKDPLKPLKILSKQKIKMLDIKVSLTTKPFQE